MPDTGPFHLVKWYLDCITPDGRCLIGYWSRLAWRGLAVTWQSADLYEPGAPPRQHWSLKPGPAPQRGDGCLTWRAPSLGGSIVVEPQQPPFAARLLDDGRGTVDWSCEVPLGRVTADVRGWRPVSGSGYVEKLELSIPPWRLPITELRWGRWHAESAARTLVWIDWRGEPDRTWVFLDGRQLAGTVADAAIAGEGFGLALEPATTLVDRTLADLGERAPPLRRLLPAAVFAFRERKRRGSGTLKEAGHPPCTGSALFEVVHMG